MLVKDGDERDLDKVPVAVDGRREQVSSNEANERLLEVSRRLIERVLDRLDCDLVAIH